MTKRVFVTADNHWFHENIVKFFRKDGITKIRPWDTLEDMHRDMKERWNATVGPEDLVYCLGDWALGNRKETVAIAEQLNGTKILIMGNHDSAPAELYLRYFKDVKACHIFESRGIVMTHIPVHERQFDRWKLNIHGHLHHDVVTREVVDPDIAGLTEVDSRYVCVSVEHTDFKPILLESVIQKAGL